MLYKIGWALCWVLIRILYKVEVIGRENIPVGKGYILAANHRTNFDPLFVATPLHAQVYFMAKAELFRNWFIGAVLRGLGAFPVERGKGDTGAIDWAESLLQNGGVLGMFPEGTRSKDGTTGRAKSGVAMIARKTGADILPCAIVFGESLKFRSLVRICFGPLIAYEDLGFTDAENSPHEIKAASRLVMDRIVALLEKYR